MTKYLFTALLLVLTACHEQARIGYYHGNEVDVVAEICKIPEYKPSCHSVVKLKPTGVTMEVPSSEVVR